MKLEHLTHCQICGRGIKANTGLIAHHGYQRPGDGWQTASCMGARHRPYEVSCDAIPPAIESCERYIAQQTAGLKVHMTESPAELKYQRKDAYGRPQGKEHTFPRPEGFDPVAHRVSYMQLSYEFQFDKIKTGYDRRIKGTCDTLAYMKDRLANWKAPQPEAGA